jgi:hemolysin activation/secretion protein
MHFARLAVVVLMLATSAAAMAQVEANPPVAAAAKLDLLEFAVEGNSRLGDAEIERSVGPYLGQRRNFADIEAARLALETTYHEAGYLTAVVLIPPEQNVSDGVVTLRVVEGEIDRLRVKGAEYHLPSGLKATLAELAEGSVPYFPEVQRELAALNRDPDLKATPVLRAGSVPGTVSVDLEVDDHAPLHGSLELSNRQTPNTTPERASASIRYDNLWQKRHSLGLTFQASPQAPSQVRVAALNYVMPQGSEGNSLALYAVHSRSSLASISGSPGLGVLGNTDVIGLRFALPLTATDQYSQSLSLGVDRKDVKQSVVLLGSESPSPIRYAPLVAVYNGGWLGQGSSTTIDVTATAGIPGLLGNRDTAFAAKRVGASASFLALRGGLQQSENFGRWSLAGKAELQLASGPLVSNEQYAGGGAESVRGYLESELLGDDALRLAVELRTPKRALGGDTSPWRLNALAFFEGVRLRTRQPVYPQPVWAMLRGSGFGLRLSAPQGAAVELDWARAIDAGANTRAGEHRLHGRLLWDF